MASAAVGAYTTRDVMRLLEDQAWTVHDGTAPAGASLPFVSVHLETPVQFAAGLADEDHGQLLDRWRFNVFGKSTDQVRQIRNEIVRRLGAGWRLDTAGQTLLDPTEQPNTYVTSLVYRSWTVAE